MIAEGITFRRTKTSKESPDPIETHFGPLRQFVITNRDHADHPTLGRAIRKYLRWRNPHGRDPRVLEADAVTEPASAANNNGAGPSTPRRRTTRERSWSGH